MSVGLLVTLTASGEVLIATSSNTLSFGSLYGRTTTTSSTGIQAVPVAVGGVVKVQMASSTLSTPNWVGGSSDGFGVLPTTEIGVFGQIVSGASGGAGRVVSVLVSRFQSNTGSVLPTV